VTVTFSKSKSGRKFDFRFSTVDDYFTAIQQKQRELNFTWPVFNGDFFPYNGYYLAHYWTGYYSSRPNFKKLIRDYTGIVQASDTFYALELLGKIKAKNQSLTDVFNNTH
jgi:hypothetical protein